MDIGTNAEIVVATQRGMTCAAPAGPAFEGQGIRCGMRACTGAIETLFIDPADLGCRTASSANPSPPASAAAG